MKKAIAMKCNRDQFDSIKDKLMGCKITSVTDFYLYNYLTNYFSGG